MSRRDDRTDNLICSFCGKSQDEVKKLIAGPTVYICDECIERIMAEGDGHTTLRGEGGTFAGEGFPPLLRQEFYPPSPFLD